MRSAEREGEAMAGTTQTIPDQFLTTAQVGERCGFSPQHAAALADSGELEIAAIAGTNGMRLFRIDDVERFAREYAVRKARGGYRRRDRAFA
jgi:hypothetical protein